MVAELERLTEVAKESGTEGKRKVIESLEMQQKKEKESISRAQGDLATLENLRAALLSDTQHTDEAARYKAHRSTMDILDDTVKEQRSLRGETNELLDRLESIMQHGSRQARQVLTECSHPRQDSPWRQGSPNLTESLSNAATRDSTLAELLGETYDQIDGLPRFGPADCPACLWDRFTISVHDKLQFQDQIGEDLQGKRLDKEARYNERVVGTEKRLHDTDMQIKQRKQDIVDAKASIVSIEAFLAFSK